MPFCTKCTKEIQQDWKVCPFCGAPNVLSEENKEDLKEINGTVDNNRSGDYGSKPVIATSIISENNFGAYGSLNIEELEPGYLIDERYELIKLIGSGAFGCVYKAFDRDRKIDKALKIIYPILGNERELAERLRTEIAGMDQFNNYRHIVKSFDFHSRGRLKFIDMEYIEGGSLRNFIDKTKDNMLSEDVVLNLAKQIAEGMVEIHKHKIIHKDLKPENILLHQPGKEFDPNQPFNAKITDFGISEKVRSTRSRLEETSRSGTRFYMSPEQLTGRRVGAEADIWSFGVILYEMLSGDYCFKGDTTEELMFSIREILDVEKDSKTREIRQFGKIEPLENVSEKTNKLLTGCLRYHFSERFRDFNQVLEFLGKKISTGKQYNKGVNTKEIKSDDLTVIQDEPAMPAVVSITSEPVGATVYIDNIKLGITPVDSFFEAGTYPLRLEKENYDTLVEEVTIIEPETRKSFSLEDIRGTLTVKTHPNATVKFNKESFKGGFKDLKLTPQVLKIKVEMPKAKTIEQVFTLQRNAVEVLELYPVVETGTIQVVSIPTDATITLRGDGGEYYSNIGRKYFKNIPVGKYELNVDNKEYKLHKSFIYLKGNEIVKEQITLEKGRNIKGFMIHVKGGSFKLKSDLTNSFGNNNKMLNIAIDSFYISKYQLTIREYDKYCVAIVNARLRENGWGSADRPAVDISWYEAISYCNWRSIQEGLKPCYSVKDYNKLWLLRKKEIHNSNDKIKCNFKANGYRLPTEAEWEYAASNRLGTSQYFRKYSGSDRINDISWYSGNSDNETHCVGMKEPNELRIFDMSGNVWEWCWDWYGDKIIISQNNPTGPILGSYKVNRGGGYDNKASLCRIDYRNRSNPDFSSFRIGLRLLRSSM